MLELEWKNAKAKHRKLVRAEDADEEIRRDEKFLKQLKSIDHDTLKEYNAFDNFKNDYTNILELCKSGEPVPEVSESKANDILEGIKPNVTDLNSITAKHYTNAGPAGTKHF